MSVVPNQVNPKISWYENHTSPWALNAVALGTTTTQTSDLTAKVLAARAAYNAQQAAQDAARGATLTLQMALEAMSSAGAEIISQIRAKAKIAGDSIYVLADIPAPATPSPRPAPGKPTDMVATLGGDGALTLTWKCINPAGSSGTMYQVWRRIGGSGNFDYLGGVGEKKFVDMTLPAGSASVTYQMQAVRSKAIGPWNQFNVNFGIGGGTMSVTEQTPSPKLAA